MPISVIVITKVSTRLKLPGLVAVLSFLIIPTNLSGDSPELTLRKDVSEVHLVFFAADKQNDHVPLLQPNDFAVVDNGVVVRDFRSFTRPEPADIKVVVLFDASESIGSRFREEISSALRLIYEAQWLPQDKLAIIAFAGTQPRLVCDGNCARSMSRADFLGTRPDGATPLFDAIISAIKLVGRSHLKSTRPALILFSDGEDTISRNSAADAVEAAIGHSAQLYAVDLGNPRQPSRGSLQSMAEATGGRYFRIQEGAEKILTAVFEDSQGAYGVSYSVPTRALGFHSVRVLPTHNQALQFRCRVGYFYENDKYQ